jgi:hypothetical protein
VGSIVTLLSIDPGKHLCGWALFEGPELAECGLSSFEKIADYAITPDDIIVEKPQIYRATKSQGNPNDLIDVAITVGKILSLFPAARVVLPREWKGSVPKKVHHARNPLTAEEKKLLPKLAKSELHNVVDAVLLGKWYLTNGKTKG